MSWRVANTCAERRFGSAARKQIIMFLADKANDDGSGIWCSKGTIQRHTELGETTVKRTVREFLKEGIRPEDLLQAVQAYATDSAGFTRSKVCFSDNWFRANRWKLYIEAVRKKRGTLHHKEAEMVERLTRWVIQREKMCRHITANQISMLLVKDAVTKSQPSAFSRSSPRPPQISLGLCRSLAWNTLMWVKLRTTPEQRAAWYAKAEAKGVTFSDLARQTLDGVTVRRRAQLRRVDPGLLRQLARLGNNLNQLARWANRDQRYAQTAQIMGQLIAIERELTLLREDYEAPKSEARDAD